MEKIQKIIFFFSNALLFTNSICLVNLSRIDDKVVVANGHVLLQTRGPKND
jgi:hypothetical protein